jgi:hypothetical protein
MKYIFLIGFLLSGCSNEKLNNPELPVYSDMGAASDAGKVKP